MGKNEIRKAIEDTGAKLVFLPTYSPDLSPIEMFWSKVKSILRSIAPRTIDELHAASYHSLQFCLYF